MIKSAMTTALGLFAALVAADPSSSATPTNREPYDVAIRCFVANGIAVSQRRAAGDPGKAAYYESKAKESFGVAYGLGDALRFSRKQIDADFERAVQVEAPTMRRDQGYFFRVVAQCKAYKFM